MPCYIYAVELLLLLCKRSSERDTVVTAAFLIYVMRDHYCT